MREHRILLTRTSLTGWFDLRPVGEVRDAISLDRFREEVAAGGKRRATVILTGGEPSLHPQWQEILALLRESRFRGFVMETDGTTYRSPEAVAELRGIAWEAIRIRLPHPRIPQAEGLLHLPGGGALIREAIGHLTAASLPVQLLVAVTRENVSVLEEYADWGVGVHLSLPDLRREGREASRWASVDEVARSVDALLRRLAPDLPVTFGHTWFVPPCAGEPLLRVQPPRSPLPDDAAHHPLKPVHLTGCDGCWFAHACPGWPTEPPGFAGGQPHPLSEEEGFVARFHAESLRVRGEAKRLPEERRMVETFTSIDHGYRRSKAILRLNYVCNMRCPFCFVNLDGASFDRETLLRAVDDLAGRGVDQLVVSGGEPTLSPHLAAVLELARARGIRLREMQTNAVTISTVQRARELRDAGLTSAFVSLHGSLAEVADRNTQLPGGFERTVAGIRHLAQAGVPVDVNYVLNALNRQDAPEFVSFFKRAFGDLPEVLLVLSVVRPNQYFEAEDRSPFCRYAELAPAIAETLRRARAEQVRIKGMEGGCGLPLCQLAPYPDVLDFFLAGDRIPQDEDSNTYLARCAGCSLRHRCNGIPWKYLAVHGGEEFHPVDEALVPSRP